jgi:hypothetical protein
VKLLGNRQYCTIANSAYALRPAEIARYFDAHVTAGYSADAWQAYTYDACSGNRTYFEREVVGGARPGKKVIMVASDEAMVDRVAADPYGIGYCSSAFADLDRVQILGITKPDGTAYLFPSANPNYRWGLSDHPDWPYMRTLYAVCGEGTWGPDGAPTFGRLMLGPGGPGTASLRAGSLFVASYLLPEVAK